MPPVFRAIESTRATTAPLFHHIGEKRVQKLIVIMENSVPFCKGNVVRLMRSPRCNLFALTLSQRPFSTVMETNYSSTWYCQRLSLVTSDWNKCVNLKKFYFFQNKPIKHCIGLNTREVSLFCLPQALMLCSLPKAYNRVVCNKGQKKSYFSVIWEKSIR